MFPQRLKRGNSGIEPRNSIRRKFSIDAGAGAEGGIHVFETIYAYRETLCSPSPPNETCNRWKSGFRERRFAAGSRALAFA
jgi:hypothetical protein